MRITGALEYGFHKINPLLSSQQPTITAHIGSSTTCLLCALFNDASSLPHLVNPYVGSIQPQLLSVDTHANDKDGIANPINAQSPQLYENTNSKNPLSHQHNTLPPSTSTTPGSLKLAKVVPKESTKGSNAREEYKAQRKLAVNRMKNLLKYHKRSEKDTFFKGGI